MELSDALAGVIERRRKTTLPDVPIVLVQGPPGTGKTALLDVVATRWRRRAPLARLSLRGVPVDVRAHRVVIAVADDLARRRQLPGQCFKRVRLASAALTPPLPTDAQDARHELLARLRTRDYVQQAIVAILGAVRPLIPTLLGEKEGAATEAGLAVLRPVAWRITAWRSPYRWFASDHRSGVDGLVQLNRWFTAGQLAEVDRALVGAFLADLRAVYRSWRTTDRYTHRPVLLLDDADAPGGEVTGGAQLRFLDVLLDIRNQHHQERGQGDPLVVVATTGTRVVPNAAGYSFGREEITGNFVECLHLTTPGRAPIHRLDLAEGAAAPLGDHGPGHLSHRFTYGHPWAEAHIKQAVAGLAEDEVDTESALTPAVVTGALKMITRACSSLVTEGLVTRSAVDEQDAAAHQVLEEMLALGGLEPGQAWELRQRLDKLVALRLWGAPGSGTMHPFFRTILLSTLSDRSPESPLGWNEVFRRLAQHHHPEHGDWHTHYELARSGDVVPAAHYLIGALHEPGAGQHWLDKLDRITRAPRQRDHEPDQHYQERRVALLAQLPDDATDQLTLMARLVTALWLGANHLGAADRIEILNAAEALSHLAERLHDGDLRDTLFKRAARYRADHGHRPKNPEETGP